MLSLPQRSIQKDRALSVWTVSFWICLSVYAQVPLQAQVLLRAAIAKRTLSEMSQLRGGESESDDGGCAWGQGVGDWALVRASVEGFIVPEQSFVPASFRLDRKPGGESESEDDGCVLAPALGDGQVARTIAFFEDLSGMVGATVADATVEGDVVQGPPADQGSVTPADPRVERELEELNQIQLTVAEGLKQLRIETASIAGSQMLPAIAHTSSGSLPDCELRSYGSRGMFSVEARGSVHRFGQPAPRGAVVITPEQLRLCGPLPGCSLLLVPVPIQSTANESLFPLPLLTGLPVPVGSSSLASVPSASGVGALAAAENPARIRGILRGWIEHQRVAGRERKPTGGQ